jgi:hypothetical protein
MLSAALLDDGDRTRINCRFHLRLFVRVFSFVWLAGVILIGGAIFVASPAVLVRERSAAPQAAFLGLLVPLFTMAFFAGLLKFCRYLARGERDYLLRFLQRSVGAVKV